MKILTVLTISLLLIGCTGTKEPSNPSTITNKLVGAWEGGHIKKDGTQKRWMQIRKNDGSYTIYFGFNKKGASYESIESGKWWIENGLFYEINPSRSSQPDVYKYKFYNEKCLIFNQESRDDSGDESEGYSFKECRSSKKIIDTKQSK